MWRLGFVVAAAGLAALAGCGPSDKLPDEDLTDLSGLPAGFTIVAACGSSIGRAYYQEPEDNGAWEDDRVTKGRYLFLRGPEGALHVRFKNAFGAWVDAEGDGGKVIEVQKNDEAREVRAVVTYPQSGVMETYSVHALPDGSRWMLWSTNKTKVGDIITKVGAYRAKCA